MQPQNIIWIASLMSRLFLSEKTYVVLLETYHIARVWLRENLIVLHANHKGTDQLAQPRSLISAILFSL